MDSDVALDPAGEEICSCQPTDLPPWVMFALSGLALLLGLVIVGSSVPWLLGNRPGDFGGGVAGSLIGLILVVAGILAFISGRSRSLQIRFHDQGVFVGRGDALDFFPYEALEDISIVIKQPSGASKAGSMALGAVSLASGNTAGLGMAAGGLKTRTFVQFSTAGGRVIRSHAFSARALDELAPTIEHIRGEEVLSRISM